jgi:tight adherence protein B
VRRLTAWADRRREQALAGQMHLVAAELAAHLRAGRTLAQSIGDVADELPEPSRSALRDVDAALQVGVSAAEALRRFDRGADGVVLASAVAMHVRVGGDLATLLDGLADALVEREAQRRAAAAATAQARATARMVAAMPVVAVGGLGVIDSAAFAALVSSPIGLAALAGSGVLTAAGLAMVRRIAAVAP